MQVEVVQCMGLLSNFSDSGADLSFFISATRVRPLLGVAGGLFVAPKACADHGAKIFIGFRTIFQPC